ncbi:MAG: class I SAM-dependent methyltransferase [Myxococcales bacterium]|nr:class I SAM-dependent methyltransferase [Myxococcales bacterium]
MSFFGELYLRSTVPFLAREVTEREVAYLAESFGRWPVRGPIVDLGCGHGRHAGPLSRALGRPLLGIDLDRLSLLRREDGFPAIRGDFFQLPLRDRSIACAYSWYSTLFVFDDDRQLPLFREVARVLAPGGLLVLHTVPWERVAAEPEAHYEGKLPDGSYLFERSTFDPSTGRDNGFRALRETGGRVLSAHFFIRYYPLPQHCELLRAAGMRMAWAHGGVAGGPPTPSSTDLIIGAEREHA